MSAKAVQERLLSWTRTTPPRAREIVLDILKASYPTPVRAQDLYHRIRKDYPNEKLPEPLPIQHTYSPLFVHKRPLSVERKPPPVPPHPEHPIRSYKFLKRTVLLDLVHRNLVKKTCSTRTPTPEELKLAQQQQRQEKIDQQGKNKKKPKQNKWDAVEKEGAELVPKITINVKGMVEEWGWIIKTPNEHKRDKLERERIAKAIEGQKKLDRDAMEKEKDKQFRAEWGHLNVRRRRAREGKIGRENKWAGLVEQSRQEGRQAAESHSI